MGLPVGPIIPEPAQNRVIPESAVVQGRVIPEVSSAATSIREGLHAGLVGAANAVSGTFQAAGKLTGIDALTSVGNALRPNFFVQRSVVEGPSLEDVATGKASPKDYLLRGVSASVPSMMASMGAAGTAAVLGAPAAGAAAAAVAASYLLSAGEVYNNLRDKGVDAPGAALAAGVPIAALDAIEPLHLAGQLRGAALKELAERVAKTSLMGEARMVAGAAAKTGLGEAATETAQEGLAAGVESAYGVGPTKRELAWRLAGSAVLGGVTGGTMGAATYGAKHAQADTKHTVGAASAPPVSVPAPEAIIEGATSTTQTPAEAPMPEQAPAGPAPAETTMEVSPSEGTQQAVQTEAGAGAPASTTPVTAPTLAFEPIDVEAARANPLVSFGLDTSGPMELGASLAMAVANAETSDVARARITLAANDALALGFDTREVAATAIEAAKQFQPNLSDAAAIAAVGPILRAQPTPEAQIETTVAQLAERLAPVLGQPAPAPNPYEEAAREAKAQRLADMLEQHGIEAADVPNISDAHWNALAGALKISPPSPSTRVIVGKLLAARRSGPELAANPIPQLLGAARRLLHRRQNLIALQPRDARTQAAMGSRVLRNALTTRQLAAQAPTFRPLQEHVRLMDLINTTSNYFKMQGEKVLQQWNTLSAKETVALTRFGIEAHAESIRVGHRLDAAEMDALDKRLGTRLNDKQKTIYVESDRFFQSGIASLHQALTRRIAAQQGAKGASPTETQIIAASNQNFFPTVGFGSYLVRNLTTGETFRFDTEAEQKGHATGLIAQGNKVGMGRLTGQELAFAGVPYAMVKDLISSLPVGEQSKINIENLAYRDSTHRLSPYDAERAIAQYAQRMGNFIARAYYREELLGTVKDAEAIAAHEMAAGLDSTATTTMQTWLAESAQHILNPETHYQALKAVLFSKFFWAMPKQAAVNLTQIPLNTLPALSAYLDGTMQIGSVSVSTPGEFRAAQILAKAIADTRQMFDPDHANRLSIEERQMFMLLTQEGVLDQTYASMVAATAHGSGLESLGASLGLSRKTARAGAHFVRAMQDRGLALFQLTEQFNRRLTALAAFRAAKLRGDPDPVAVARRLVQTTQGSYEGSNIPRLARGHANILYVFKTYLQNQLYFYRHEPGGVRGMLYLAAFAGLMGLPFAENLADLADLFLTKAKEALKLPYPKTDTRQWLREYFNQVVGGSEVVMNGFSRHTDSLVDISGSLSMGNILPTEGPTKGALGAMRPERAMLRTLEELTGVAGAQGMNFLRASVTPSDEGTNWLNFALPQAVRNWMDAARAATAGEFQTASGKRLVPLDLRDPWSQAELLAKVLGFQPASVSRARDAKYSYWEEVAYYTTRRELALNAVMTSIVSKRPEERKRAMEGFAEFNRTSPPAFRMGADELTRSIRERMENRTRDALGLPTEDRYAELARRYQESFK